jgi:hypothetical protein
LGGDWLEGSFNVLVFELESYILELKSFRKSSRSQSRMSTLGYMGLKKSLFGLFRPWDSSSILSNSSSSSSSSSEISSSMGSSFLAFSIFFSKAAFSFRCLSKPSQPNSQIFYLLNQFLAVSSLRPVNWFRV